MRKTTYSIIIPAYNAENTIAKCLDSVLQQTLSDFEAIIIDDGSKDRTLEIIRSYSERDERFVVVHQENKGVSSSRNKGLELSKGEYIVFVDSDDFIDPDYLDVFHKHTEDIIICGFKSFGSNSGTPPKFESGIYEKKDIPELINRYFHHDPIRTPWAKVFKRTCLHDVTFDTTLKLCEDTVLNFRAFCNADNISIIDYNGYNYNTESKFYPFRSTDYKYALLELNKSLKILYKYNRGCGQQEIYAKINGLLFSFFMHNLWTTSFRQSLSESLRYYLIGAILTTPYRGIKKLKKNISILLIPYIKLLKSNS